MEQLFGEDEGELNPAIPAMAAMLATLAGVVAELDSAQEGATTTEGFLDRLDAVFNTPLTPFQTLLLGQEEKLNAYRAMFRQLVEQSKDEFRVLNALAEGAEEDTPPAPHPADVVAEGATGRAILVLTASLSLAIERSPVDKETFLALFETFLRNGIREHGTRPPETDWLLEVLAGLATADE